MKSALLHRIAFAVLLAGLLLPAAQLRADDAPALKIGICNPRTVVTTIQEFKDLNAKATTEVNQIQADAQKKKDDLTKLQTDMKLLDPNSAQYAQRNEELLRKSIEADTDIQLSQLKQARAVRAQKIALFTKMRATIKTVATGKGFLLVISDHALAVDELDKISDQNLDAALLQDTVMWSDTKLDITQDVITQMNLDYQKK